MPVLLILFVLMPIAEMVVLIKVGGMIGALNTVVLVFFTAAVGLLLLRQQGPSTLLRAQQKMHAGQAPVKEVVEGVFLAVGGALLLTPGFITDFIGFCCLVPGLRQGIIALAIRHLRFSVFTVNGRPNHNHAGDTFEGEFSHEPEGKIKKNIK